MRLFGHDFEHPRAILIDDRKRQIVVLLRDVFLTELELVFGVGLQEVALDFLPPFDGFEIFGFAPVCVEPQAVQELADAYSFEMLLLLLRLLEAGHRS